MKQIDTIEHPDLTIYFIAQLIATEIRFNDLSQNNVNKIYNKISIEMLQKTLFNKGYVYLTSKA